MNLKKLIIVIATCVLAMAAMAQGRGGGMFGGPGNPTALLTRNDVQTDIQLTDAQKAKLQDIRDNIRSDFQQAMQEAGQDPDARQKAFATIGQKISAQINAVLTPDQQKRLEQINMQVNGYSVVAFDKNLQTQLNLSADVVTKITGYQQQQTQANTSVFQKMRSGELQQEDAMAAIKKNSDALNSAIEAILTPDQKNNFKTLSGKPFVATAGTGGPGGR